MSGNVVLRVIAKLFLPFILLFALYVQFHGHYGAGGGFQAGVIFAAGFVLYGLVWGVERAQAVAPPAVLEAAAALGVLIYAGTGAVSLFLGGNFLDYNVLAHDPVHGQHVGIFLVELGVGITVSAVMMTIFLSFAARRPGSGGAS